MNVDFQVARRPDLLFWGIRSVNYILSGLVFLIPVYVINHSSGTINHAQPAHSSRSI
jgi:hypothetical protein